MRVLVVHNRYRSTQPSGENSVVDDEVRLLREHGVTVELLETSSDSIADAPRRERIALPARVVWSTKGHRLVADAARAFAPDVVHLHNTFPLLSPTAYRAARESGHPVVATLHNFRPLCAAGTFLRAGKVCTSCLGHGQLAAVAHGCYRDSRAATLPVAAMIAVHRAAGTWRTSVDRYIVPSSFARSLYMQAGWPDNRLVIKANASLAPASPRKGAGSGFVAVARLTPEKGIDTLIDAWRLAKLEEPLTVIGSGEESSRLRECAAGARGITFTGQLPAAEVAAHVVRARALVVPSRCYEVAPRAVIEAFAAGVPVIASRIGSLEQLVTDGRTGLHTDADSPESLAVALRRIAGSDELSEQLGIAARDAWRTSHSPEVTTRQLLSIYESVIDERRRIAA